MTQTCEGCYQAILQTPRQCFTCGQSIQPGQSYRYRKARAGCEPVHVQCFSDPPSRAYDLAKAATAAKGKALARPRTFFTESDMLAAMEKHGGPVYDDDSEEGRLL